jgi:hypothetical protein
LGRFVSSVQDLIRIPLPSHISSCRSFSRVTRIARVELDLVSVEFVFWCHIIFVSILAPKSGYGKDFSVEFRFYFDRPLFQVLDARRLVSPGGMDSVESNSSSLSRFEKSTRRIAFASSPSHFLPARRLGHLRRCEFADRSTGSYPIRYI